MTDIDLSDLAAGHDGSRSLRGYLASPGAPVRGHRALRPLLRVAGIGPEPESAKDARRRIELFLATHLN